MFSVNESYKIVYTVDYRFEVDSKPKWYGWVGWLYMTPLMVEIECNESFASSIEHRFQEGEVVNYYDNDGFPYTIQHEVHARATRLLSKPGMKQYKDLIGHSISVYARTEPIERGVSGVGVTVKQFGRGIASNEFHVCDPELSEEPSTSMAAIQAVCKPYKQDADLYHVYRAISAVNKGKTASALIMGRSVEHESGDGKVRAGIDLSEVKVAPGGAAIKMPQSTEYSEGTVIEYMPGCYTVFDRFNKRFLFVIDNEVVAVIDKSGVH